MKHIESSSLLNVNSVLWNIVLLNYSKKATNMPKSKPATKNSLVSEVKKSAMDKPASSQQLEPQEQEVVVIPPDNHIFVCIDSIINIIPALNSRESAIKIRLQLGDSFIFDSQVIRFSDPLEKRTSIGWLASIPCFTSEAKHLDFLTSNPIIISIAEVDVNELEKMELSPNLQNELLFNAFAFCTLDLIPLILGESEFRQTLLLEIHQKIAKKDTKGKSPLKENSSRKKTAKEKSNASNKGSKKKSSKMSGASKEKDEKKTEIQDYIPLPAIATEPPSVALLPQITVSAFVEKPIVSREIVKESNIVFITLESIHNLPESIDAEAMYFQAATLIPTEFDNEQVVHFGEGTFKRQYNEQRLKRWINVDNVPGNGACTHYAFSENLFAVRNALDVDLCQVMSSDGPRVEWNKLKRSWISSSGAEYLSDFIHKHTTWMLEVMASPKDVGKNPKGLKGEVNKTSDDVFHFVAFFDISKLTYPGLQSVRCVGQLVSYCKDDVVEKCGSRSRTLLSPPPEKIIKPEKTMKPEKGSKAKTKADKKGKSASDSISKGTTKGAPKNVETVELPPALSERAAEVVPCIPTPWLNEKGEPVFVVLELELMKPLKRRMTDEELFEEANRQIPSIPPLSQQALAAKKAGEDHTALIHHLTRHLTKRYHSFLSQRRIMKLAINVGEQLTRDFYQYLKENGTIDIIKGQIYSSIDVLLKNKFGHDTSNKFEKDIKVKQKYVSDLYVRLFEDVNTIINTVIDTVTVPAKPMTIPETQMRMLGVEARTLGFASRQRQIYLENLRQNNADMGAKFLYTKECDELNTALEHTLNVLVENRDSKEGLLLYAVLLTQKGDMKNAEIFLQTMVAKNPYSLFSGYLLHLFYMMTGNQTAADVVWETTRKLTYKKPQPVMEKGFYQMLDWDANMYDLKTVHLKCIQLLLYVRIFTLEFTYLALEVELKQYGPSEPYFYFLSVCHYRARRYEEACSILEGILVVTPRLNHIRRLLAHCQYEMGCQDKAILNYEFVVETSPDGMANHLVHIRLGDHYLDCEDYNSAKAIFFESCYYTPTAKSWLGVGIACYMQKNYKESEQALTEANYLDKNMPLVWAYLTLLNLQLCRPGPFEQCFARAYKYNLKDEKVIGMIDEMTRLRGFTKPQLVHSDILGTTSKVI